MGCCCGKRKDEAFSTELVANQPADFYLARADAYFNLISGKDSQGKNLPSNFLKPEYSKFMVRWEWEPWLLLTGKNDGWKEEWELIDSTLPLSLPSVISNRVYRFSTVNPYIRSIIDIKYEGSARTLRIYEEFTFNDHGQMTFIEAWTFDDPKVAPEFNVLEKESFIDPSTNRFWPDETKMYRMSTLLPGLGAKGTHGQPLVAKTNSVGMKKAFQKEAAVVKFMRNKSRLGEFRAKYLKPFADQYAAQYAKTGDNKDIAETMDSSKVPAHLLQSALKGDLSRALKAEFDIIKSGEKKHRFAAFKKKWEEKKLMDVRAPSAAKAAKLSAAPIG